MRPGKARIRERGLCLTRRQFLGAGAATTVAASAFGAARAKGLSHVEKPNILFIFSDQQRWDTLGCYGDTMGRALRLTPNLDAMAAEGVRFENAFTCQPVCGPARACLQTGRYATEMGCFRNNIHLPMDADTVPKRLRPAGYEVSYIGKWHLASSGQEQNYREKAVPPERRGGYDDYWLAADTLEVTSHSYDGHMFDGDMKRVEFPEGRYRVDAVTDFAEAYLRNRNGDRPFFLFLSYLEPHHQNDHNHFEGPKGSKEKYKNYPVPEDLRDHGGDWREEMPDYLGCCASLDASVGRLRGVLEQLDLAKNTLVIYTSDHGCHFRTRNDEYKRSGHDNSIRVPLILYGPGFRGGRIVDELVSLIDLPPTIMDKAGLPVPEFMRGRPLQKLVTGDAKDWPDDVFVQISEVLTGRAVRTRRWKYSAKAPGKTGWRENYRRSASDVYEEHFLYDLKEDPAEQNNLIRDPNYEDVRTKMRQRLLTYIARVEETAPEIRPAPALPEDSTDV